MRALKSAPCLLILTWPELRKGGESVNGLVLHDALARLRGRQSSLLIRVLLLLGMMVPCLAMAEEAGKSKEGAASERGYEDWHVLFYLPGWLAGMKGDAVAKGIKADLDVSVWQSIKNLQYLESIGLGHLEVKKGRWGLLLEGPAVSAVVVAVPGEVVAKK